MVMLLVWWVMVSMMYLRLRMQIIGIAMANGADAAKQAAHIVLLDSNFSSNEGN